MDNHQRSKLEDLDMTKEEFNQIKEAFKKEEFVKMFADYVDEVHSPENRAVYEQEITQLEKERGVDITFIHPNPGYVIKTSENGKQKAFINICYNDNIGKPSSQRGMQGNSYGLNWSLPYIQAYPRTYIDKRNKVICYDVVFHSDTLHLARKSSQFKQFVNDTALTAVEETFKVALDRRNIKFPKAQYKGTPEPTVLRRKSTSTNNNNDIGEENSDSEPFQIPNYPYGPVEAKEPKITTPKQTSAEGYTTPTYDIKHRKGIEMHEFTNELDAKVYAATPTELVVTIDLPLVRSASDVSLDVYEKSLALSSDKPAKYKLDIDLPWPVDEENGNAKFDKSTKKLYVTLPVVRRKYEVPHVVREDSGIESDHSQSVKSSSEEDISAAGCTEKVIVLDKSKQSIEESYRTSEACVLEKPFLSPDYFYALPNHNINILSNKIAVVFHVNNVDLSSVKHKLFDNNSEIIISFTSIGSGFFPVHYAFYVKIPSVAFDPSAVYFDHSNENLVVRVMFAQQSCVKEYFVGINKDSARHEVYLENMESGAGSNINESYAEDTQDIKSIEDDGDSLSVLMSELTVSGKSVEKKEINSNNDLDNSSLLNNNNGVDEVLLATSENAEGKKLQINRGALKKLRTLSECSVYSSVVPRRRSILKGSRSLSESNADDYSVWSSIDSSDSCVPEEMSVGNNKKTVRFSDIISQKFFRANSSILGQRKKNQRKSRNKKRAHERRASESAEEASGSEMDIGDSSGFEDSSVSENSEVSSEEESNSTKPEIVPSSKTHRRRGSKNKRKNAATAKHYAAFNVDE